MSEELRMILIPGAIGVLCSFLFLWIFNKTNIGKKKTREEIEEKNFGRK